MKVIFGVGNPGERYKFTRHNVGFEVIDRLATLNKVRMKLFKNWLVGTTSKMRLIKPLSFVNECGMVAKDMISIYEVEIADFLVVVDDFALPLGNLRMKPKGSSGGHRGLESIIYHLESSDFPRIRVGIGPKSKDAVDFVLSKFKKSEFKVLDEVIERAILSINVFIREGIDSAMKVCNTR